MPILENFCIAARAEKEWSFGCFANVSIAEYSFVMIVELNILVQT